MSSNECPPSLYCKRRTEQYNHNGPDSELAN